MPQALAFSIGPATPVCGATRASAVTIANHITMHIFQFTGGVNQMISVTSSNSGVTWGDYTYRNISSTGFSTTSGNGSPEKLMVTRGSVRLRNFTKVLDLEGVTRVLRVSTPIPGVNSTELLNLLNLVNGNIRTRTYTNHELLKTHQWDAVPVDQSSYAEFRTPTQATNVIQTPALSALVFVQEATGAPQSYEFGMATTAWARYSEIGPLASMAVRPPTLPMGTINSVRDKAESIGSAASAVGDAVFRTVRTIGKLAYGANAIRQAVQGGAGAFPALAA